MTTQPPPPSQPSAETPHECCVEMVGSSFSPTGDTMYRPKCSCGWTTDLQFFGSWAYDEWEKHARASDDPAQRLDAPQAGEQR